VVGVVFSQLELNAPIRTVITELHSLAPGGLSGDWGDETKWRVEAGDIEYQTIEDAPAPADVAPLRRAQMRVIAQRFSGTTFREKPMPLEVLRQPLLTYESPELSVLTGGLFGLFDERDIEIVLQIEARIEDGEATWVYLPVRLSDKELEMRYQNQRVWSDPRRGYLDPSSPFFAPRIEQHDPELKDVELGDDVAP